MTSSPSPFISANLLTAARLPLAPLAVILLLTHTTWGTIGAAALALVLEITDLLDGRIARSYGQVTSFGKLFDPFSDAFSRFTLFLGLYAIGVADLWMIVVIFYRDSSISFFRSVAAIRNVVLAARASGKFKAIVQGVGTQVVFVALVVFDLAPSVPIPRSLPWWTMVVITAVTFASFVDYFVANLPILRAAWSDEPMSPPRESR
ncbi:MAG: CDP-alcohol phosphatidyltransferase family protein [Myxococcota bacterium]